MQSARRLSLLGAVGDQVLAGVADVLQKHVRASDLVKRYGGDEFVVILPLTDAIGAHEIAEKIRGEAMRIHSGNVALTISMGVATCDESTATPRALLRKADRSLYQAKKNGKNQTSA